MHHSLDAMPTAHLKSASRFSRGQNLLPHSVSLSPLFCKLWSAVKWRFFLTKQWPPGKSTPHSPAMHCTDCCHPSEISHLILASQLTWGRVDTDSHGELLLQIPGRLQTILWRTCKDNWNYTDFKSSIFAVFLLQYLSNNQGTFVRLLNGKVKPQIILNSIHFCSGWKYNEPAKVVEKNIH